MNFYWYIVGNVKVVECLIKGGANVNAINNDNETPLIRATKNGNENVSQCFM